MGTIIFSLYCQAIMFSDLVFSSTWIVYVNLYVSVTGIKGSPLLSSYYLNSL